MKYFLAGLLFLYQPSFCQDVTGIVINGNDNSKMVAASVFVNNSSKGTMTDEEGKFSISGITATNFELVISYTGFATVSLNITPDNIHEFHTVKLFPRKQDLQEVDISAPEKEGWKHWGKLFTELFMGTSDFASQCSIQNPEVLKFTSNKTTSVLHVYSNAPLIIHNDALGYMVKYQLEDFNYDAKHRVISYLGYAEFKDQVGDGKRKDVKWRSNRHEAYEGSLLHFMRVLYSDSLVGFVVHRKIRIKADDTLFSRLYKPDSMPKYVRSGDRLFRIRLGPTTAYKKIPPYIDLVDTSHFSFHDAVRSFPDRKQKTFYFDDYLDVTYKNAFAKADYLQQHFISSNVKMLQTSSIILISDQPITIEENGLFFNPLNLLVTGYWEWLKMAETLPSDYVDNN